LWWVLLVLPAGLMAGWLLGEMPVPRLAPGKASGGAAPAGMSRRGAAEGGAAIDASSPAQAASPTISQWTTLDNAIAESRGNGKPVLIDFNAEWCGPCRMMKQSVFDDWAHGQAVQAAVIPVSIVDRAREEGRNPPEIENLQQQYQVDAFPTLIVFSPATGRVERTKGFGGADWTLRWITEAAQSVSR